MIGALAALVGLLAVTCVGMVRSAKRERRVIREEWQAAAASLDLEVETAGGDLLMRGEVDGVRVAAHGGVLGPGARYERATVFATGAVPPSLSLLPVAVATPDAWACAALCEEVRPKVQALLELDGSVSEGRVSLPVATVERQSLANAIRFAAQIASMLGVTPELLPGRLAHNARFDTLPSVRAANLRWLCREEGAAYRERVEQACRAALEDADAEVRLIAATRLGEPALDTLLALAESSELAPTLRGQALAALARASRADAQAAVEAGFRQSPPGELIRAALEHLDEAAQPRLVPLIVEAARLPDPGVARAAVGALGRSPSPLARAALLGLLSDKGPTLVVAVEALGQVGGVEAVEPLSRLASAWLSPTLRSAARSAIATIQGRLGDVEPGRVSLAEQLPAEGALSLASDDSQRGRVSVEGAPRRSP